MHMPPSSGGPGSSSDGDASAMVEANRPGGDSTFEQALFNSVNILLGVGLLSVPGALAKGGWAALGVLGLLGVVTNYTGKAIVRCQEYDLRAGIGPVLESYEDIGERAFGPAGRAFITTVLYTELIGTCGLFFILASAVQA